MDALHPPEEAVDDDVESGLLEHLPDDGFMQRLAQLHAAPRDGPGARRRTVAAADQEDGVVSQCHCADGDVRTVHARSRGLCITSARAVNPCSSKKFLAARWPG